MKKPYQIESQRAVKRLEEMVAEGNPAVQMGAADGRDSGLAAQGVGELIRQAGLQMIELLREEEVRKLAGERSQRQPERTANPLLSRVRGREPGRRVMGRGSGNRGTTGGVEAKLRSQRPRNFL